MTGAFPNRAQRRTLDANSPLLAVLASVCDAIDAMPPEQPTYAGPWKIVTRTGTSTLSGWTSTDYWDVDRICERLNSSAADAARPYRIERTNPSTQEATT